MYVFHLLLLSILMFSMSCGDSLNIFGITETDESAELIGNIDENDWCTNAQDGWALHPAYPNPTNNSTTLIFSLAKMARVKLQIINKDKKVVKLLVDEFKPAGFFSVQWNLLDNNDDRVKNGFYRVQFFVDGEFKCHGDIQVKK